MRLAVLNKMILGNRNKIPESRHDAVNLCLNSAGNTKLRNADVIPKLYLLSKEKLTWMTFHIVKSYSMNLFPFGRHNSLTFSAFFVLIVCVLTFDFDKLLQSFSASEMSRIELS